MTLSYAVNMVYHVHNHDEDIFIMGTVSEVGPIMDCSNTLSRYSVIL